MAKKKISFKTSDGTKPRKLDSVGKPFGLRLPFTVHLPPRTNKEINLGVSCELPSILVPNEGASARGPAVLVAPGETYKIKLVSGDENVTIGEGEVVARVFVVDNSDLELSE